MHSFNQYKWISGNKQRISFNLRLQRRYLLIWMFIDIEKPLLTGDPRTHLLRRSLTKQFAFLPFKKQNYPPRKAIYVIICQSLPFNVEFNPSSHCQSNSNWNSKIGAISIHLGKHLKFMLKLSQKWWCFYIYLQINLFIYFFCFFYTANFNHVGVQSKPADWFVWTPIKPQIGRTKKEKRRGFGGNNWIVSPYQVLSQENL